MDRAVLDALFNLRGKIELGLGPTTRLLEKLGRPERGLDVVHIAGTNGKGSTLAGLEALLSASGFKTGAFISPHLVRFNERYRINGRPVEDGTLDRALEAVCAALGVRPEDLPRTDEKTLGASFFEISFALALWIFAQEGVDWALIETGLGGRLDATNALEAPRACVLTRIGLDHMDYLGETLPEIAQEKLAILKPGALAVLAPQVELVRALARRKAQDLGLELIEAQPEATEGLELGLVGAYQRENLATALTAYQRLCPPARQLDRAGVAQTFKNLRWPGRLEYVAPNLLLDGAHNQDGLAGLLAHLKERHGHQRILLGLGWMQGKNLLEPLQETDLDLTFLPLKGRFYGAEPQPEASLRPLGPCLEPLDPGDALTAWRRGEFDRFDLTVLAGSLYLIGELKALLE